jgi:hypothetical protein
MMPLRGISVRSERTLGPTRGRVLWGGDRSCEDRSMTVLFDAEILVSYRFVYLLANGADYGNAEADSVAGQENGLCGARVPGELRLITGLHTGEVRFRVEWWLGEPRCCQTPKTSSKRP